VCVKVGSGSVNPLDRNLAYRSPFESHPQVNYAEPNSPYIVSHFCIKLEVDTRRVHERHARAFAKRQLQEATGFTDGHYPTFFGGDFNNVIPCSKHRVFDFPTSLLMCGMPGSILLTQLHLVILCPPLSSLGPAPSPSAVAPCCRTKAYLCVFSTKLRPIEISCALLTLKWHSRAQTSTGQ
jgi:hypothetical protein